MLASGNEKQLQTRISAIEMSKSLINAVLLGTDEEYVRDSASVAGLADLLDRFMMLVSAVADIPVTKLFGRSASGLNATGEGDQKSYYDKLGSEQSALTPEIERFIQMLVHKNGLDDGDYSWKWGNLTQLTSEQLANEKRINAETLRTNMDASQRAVADGVLTPEQVYNLFWKEQVGEEYDDEEFDMPDEGAIDDASAVPANTPSQSEISNSKTESFV